MQGLHFINEGLLGLVDGEKGSSLHACIKSAIEISSTTTVFAKIKKKKKEMSKLYKLKRQSKDNRPSQQECFNYL